MREALPSPSRQEPDPGPVALAEEEQRKLDRWRQDSPDLDRALEIIADPARTAAEVGASEDAFNRVYDRGKEGAYSTVYWPLENGRTVCIRRDGRGSTRIRVDLPSGDAPGGDALEPTEPGEPDEDRTVSVEGRYLGRTFRSFPLDALVDPEPMMGADRFTAVFFATESGNLYALYENPGGDGYSLADARSNAGRGNAPHGHHLDREGLAGRTVEVGKPFSYGRTRRTARVMAITAVNTGREVDPESLREISDGRTSDLLQRFQKMVAEAPRP